MLFPALLLAAITRVPFDASAGSFVIVGILTTLTGALLGYLAIARPTDRTTFVCFGDAVRVPFQFVPGAGICGKGGSYT